MAELSIFIDESGDVGKYQPHSPYYIVAMVMHRQDDDLTGFLDVLNQQITHLGYDDKMIHTAPLIRKEEAYSNLSPNDRRTLFSKLYYFAIKIPIKYKVFIYEKKDFHNSAQLETKFFKDVSMFIRENLSYFQDFDNVILYYDGGQQMITRIINKAFAEELSRYDIRKAMPRDYRLLQVADLICTISLVKKKLEDKEFTKSERLIFHSRRDFYKDYVKKLEIKKM